jgi:hypothetical protein
MHWGNTASHVLPKETGKDGDNVHNPPLHGVPGKNKESESSRGIDKYKDVL